MSDQNLPDELAHAAKLNPKHRGELAELAFMRKAANLGFAVAKPWGDSDRYDVVVRSEKTFWRVQIKSVLAKASRRKHYRLGTRDWQKKSYSPKDIRALVCFSGPRRRRKLGPDALILRGSLPRKITVSYPRTTRLPLANPSKLLHNNYLSCSRR